MKKILFLLVMLLFNINHIDSNSSKKLIYDKYEENKEYYEVYLIKSDINEINNILSILDIEVYSLEINDKKYYFRNIHKLIDELYKDKAIEEKIYIDSNKIYVDKINIRCNSEELIKFKNMVDIY